MIDAEELVSVNLSPDGTHIRLRVRDQDGRIVALALPACWLNAMQEALPPARLGDKVHPVDSWSVEHSVDGQTLMLTLRTPEGMAASFALKSWQMEGMATVAAHGRGARPQAVTVH